VSAPNRDPPKLAEALSLLLARSATLEDQHNPIGGALWVFVLPNTNDLPAGSAE
jgi:hypothetical protein